jgi:hypothetical protein
MLKWLGMGVLLVVAAIALFYLFHPRHLVLKITAANSGQLVLCAQMAEGEEFILSFLHSVNQRPVYDTIRMAEDYLWIVKSRYDSFGAGMPETSTEDGKLKLGGDGWLEWTVHRAVPEIRLFVGRVAHHSLRLKNREIALASLCEPGTSLSMRPLKISPYEMWEGRCLR